jgi:hypothetical protein
MASRFRSLIGLALALPVLFTCVYAQQPHVNEPDPKALAFNCPRISSGATAPRLSKRCSTAINEEGLCVVLNKWLPLTTAAARYTR